MRYYIFLLLVVLFAGPAFGQGENNEVIFKAMQDEMERTREQLVLPDQAKAFYVSYAVARSRDFEVTGSLGSVAKSAMSDWNTVCSAQLLMGDYNHTSDTRYVGQFPAMRSSSEVDYDMLRRTFWMLSDAVYKMSLQEDAAKKAYLQTNPLSPELAALPELTKAEPVEKIVEREKPFDVDLAKMEEMVKRVSAIFKEYKDIYNSSVSVYGTEIEFYKSTSEGVVLKQPSSYTSLSASCYVLTDDGVKIADSYSLLVATPEDLPSVEEVEKGVREFAEGLIALKNAPVLEEYYAGPILFEGSACSSLFIGNLLNQSGLFAYRPAIGDRRQVSTLENRLDRKIIDNRFTIKNYTSMKEYDGKDLLGAYDIDAEGVVPAAEMTLVDRGILKMFLNGRVPALKAPVSTGSSRFVPTGQSVAFVTAPGTIHIQVEDGTKPEKMKKALIKAAKEEGLDYAYIVRSLGQQTSRIYKVDVKDGSETQVRFPNFSSIDLSQLKRVREISNKEVVSNYILNQMTLSSLIYPSAMIVDDVEIDQLKTNKEKEPALTYPLQR